MSTYFNHLTLQNTWHFLYRDAPFCEQSTHSQCPFTCQAAGLHVWTCPQIAYTLQYNVIRLAIAYMYLAHSYLVVYALFNLRLQKLFAWHSPLFMSYFLFQYHHNKKDPWFGFHPFKGVVCFGTQMLLEWLHAGPLIKNCWYRKLEETPILLLRYGWIFWARQHQTELRAVISWGQGRGIMQTGVGYNCLCTGYNWFHIFTHNLIQCQYHYKVQRLCY